MGLLIDGEWHDKWYDTESTGGKFEREKTKFRNRVTADGSSGFKAEKNRYHLYVSLACPWAHRTLIFRKLKNLEDVISLSVVHPHMGENGWEFGEYPGSTGDTLNGFSYLHQVYTLAEPDFTGRVTVPVLWDKHKETIVNNESAEIIRMLNSEFDEFSSSVTDYYPEELRPEIDEINSVVYENVNNGVYKCGFATKQNAYEEAFHSLFDTLDSLEKKLHESRYLAGERITEADWRLFTTLVRFDPVYHTHFKCNRRKIAEYPALNNYLKELYQYDDVRKTVNFDHIKTHYYSSHKNINPTGIIAVGPDMSLDAPHNRENA